MNLIVDASVAAKWLVPEIDSDKAEALLARWERRGLVLTAPETLAAEIASILWKRTFRGLLPADEAVGRYRDFVRLNLPLAPIGGLVARALALAIQYRQTVYDCLYVALAVEKATDLITADEKLHRSLVREFPQVRLLRDWA